MNLFQYLALSVLALVLGIELYALMRSRGRPGIPLVRCLVWLAAALGIAFPSAIQAVATAIGIGRGADVVLYLLVLAFLAVTFYFYSRQVGLQRQITELARHIALGEAQRGGHEKSAD